MAIFASIEGAQLVAGGCQGIGIYDRTVKIYRTTGNFPKGSYFRGAMSAAANTVRVGLGTSRADLSAQDPAQAVFRFEILEKQDRKPERRPTLL
ncbi:hypothetical protein [Roseixanthobacter pseudopolyaromaticivorans]|uniref:hypothetical protein n=1 Tax=Xanthobacteraceae TaxID=335928 RepID=UPI00372B3AC5